MKKLKLKKIKSNLNQPSATALSDLEISKLKGGGQGCVTMVVYPGGGAVVIDSDPTCDYPNEIIYA